MNGGEIFFIIVGSVMVIGGIFAPKEDIQPPNPLKFFGRWDFIGISLALLSGNLLRMLLAILRYYFPKFSFILMGMAMIAFVFSYHYL